VFAGSAEEILKSMTRMVEMFKALPIEEQEHQSKYHLGSVFLDCPICGHKGVKL
jgi:hypothetical protein